MVCTQPRALAATSISERIAEEFDGSTVGYNVGYKASNRVYKKGKLISLMTDSALVRMAQEDSLLTAVSVLIIDEAHERSLNTDLVLGIAKRIRERRSNDFFVVIASATIDPEPFLRFFFGQARLAGPSSLARSPLVVEGRTFPVTLAKPVIPKDKSVSVLKELLIPTLIQSLRKYNEGHCLVFLPGPPEVDKAIKLFREHDDFQPNWEPLPLHGGLAPEEQNRIFKFESDGINGSSRMIVFCTRIAETSLTVEGVKLVVDSGLARESRFDPRRRITVQEDIMVSKSSADQRKGRAGRMSPGVCVRLYDYNALPRDSIEPELLRSSLDMVVLQLCRLGGEYHPSRFHFVDAPDPENLTASLTLLKSLGCLSANGDITERGRLFNDLPFDPRMSNFVMTMYERFDLLGLGAELAAIMTSPGPLHYMGGSDAAAKTLKYEQLAKESSLFDSDLINHHTTYSRWKASGAVASLGKCTSCGQAVPPHGCTRCRQAYARNSGLNNKTCDTVSKTAAEVLEVITKSVTRGKRGQLMDDNDRVAATTDVGVLEAIGKSLVGNFLEQIGELLQPFNPQAGVFLASSGLKGFFSSESCYINNAAMVDQTGDCPEPFVIAMTLKLNQNGRLFLGCTHPLKREWIPEELLGVVNKRALDMSLCYSRHNVNYKYRNMIQRYFDMLPGCSVTGTGGRLPLESFILCSFDKRNLNIQIYAPRAIAARVAAMAQLEIDKRVNEDLSQKESVVIGGGSAVVVISAGEQGIIPLPSGTRPYSQFICTILLLRVEGGVCRRCQCKFAGPIQSASKRTRD